MLLMLISYNAVPASVPVNYDTYLHGTVRTTGAIVTTVSTPPR
jgi:hypothetical protein